MDYNQNTHVTGELDAGILNDFLDQSTFQELYTSNQNNRLQLTLEENRIETSLH